LSIPYAPVSQQQRNHAPFRARTRFLHTHKSFRSLQVDSLTRRAGSLGGRSDRAGFRKNSTGTVFLRPYWRSGLSCFVHGYAAQSPPALRFSLPPCTRFLHTHKSRQGSSGGPAPAGRSITATLRAQGSRPFVPTGRHPPHTKLRSQQDNRPLQTERNTAPSFGASLRYGLSRFVHGYAAQIAPALRFLPCLSPFLHTHKRRQSLQVGAAPFVAPNPKPLKGM